MLASKSPRRREILRDALGLEFEVMLSQFEENLDMTKLKPNVYAMMTAKEKAKDVAKRLIKNNESSSTDVVVVISADTVVEGKDGSILEKPKDFLDARRMIEMYSGNSHKVHTGVCVALSNKKNNGDGNFHTSFREFSETTVVNFAEIEPKEIDAYLETNEWADKAGGYGIQGYASAFIQGISGDYFNVVGFPVHAFARNFREILKDGTGII